MRAPHHEAGLPPLRTRRHPPASSPPPRRAHQAIASLVARAADSWAYIVLAALLAPGLLAVALPLDAYKAIAAALPSGLSWFYTAAILGGRDFVQGIINGLKVGLPQRPRGTLAWRHRVDGGTEPHWCPP